MPTIRISDESMQRLKAWAEPLVDSADSALAKALDAAERYRETPDPTEPGPVSRSGPRGEPSPELSEGEFREPLLEVIYERGGSARGRDLYPALRERMKRYLTPGEFDRAKSGDERWRSTVKSAREHLVQEGISLRRLAARRMGPVQGRRRAGREPACGILGELRGSPPGVPGGRRRFRLRSTALRPAAARPVSYLVDTNVVSELRKRRRANQSVVACSRSASRRSSISAYW